MTTERTEGKRSLWAARRARLGVPLRMLAKASGVAAPYLSLMEQGRGIPTALDKIEAEQNRGTAA
jgi:predicted transcriptional regulator